MQGAYTLHVVQYRVEFCNMSSGGSTVMNLFEVHLYRVSKV